MVLHAGVQLYTTYLLKPTHFIQDANAYGTSRLDVDYVLIVYALFCQHFASAATLNLLCTAI